MPRGSTANRGGYRRKHSRVTEAAERIELRALLKRKAVPSNELRARAEKTTFVLHDLSKLLHHARFRDMCTVELQARGCMVAPATGDRRLTSRCDSCRALVGCHASSSARTLKTRRPRLRGRLFLVLGVVYCRSRKTLNRRRTRGGPPAPGSFRGPSPPPTHTAPQRSSTRDSADPVYLLLAWCATTELLQSRVSGDGSCPGRLEPLCSPALLSECLSAELGVKLCQKVTCVYEPPVAHGGRGVATQSETRHCRIVQTTISREEPESFRQKKRGAVDPSCEAYVSCGRSPFF